MKPITDTTSSPPTPMKPAPTGSRAETLRAINRLLSPSLDEWNGKPLAAEIYDRFVAPLKREQAIASSSIFTFERMLEQLYTQNFRLSMMLGMYKPNV